MVVIIIIIIIIMIMIIIIMINDNNNNNDYNYNSRCASKREDARVREVSGVALHSSSIVLFS